MYSQIRTSMLDGICAMPVQVEVDISMGMPVFDMVGYLSPEVREAKERVRTAQKQQYTILKSSISELWIIT